MFLKSKQVSEDLHFTIFPHQSELAPGRDTGNPALINVQKYVSETLVLRVNIIYLIGH